MDSNKFLEPFIGDSEEFDKVAIYYANHYNYPGVRLAIIGI